MAFKLKSYRVICYMRIDPEKDAPLLSITEAEGEKTHLEFLQPENIYRIEQEGR